MNSYHIQAMVEILAKNPSRTARSKSRLVAAITLTSTAGSDHSADSLELPVLEKPQKLRLELGERSPIWSKNIVPLWAISTFPFLHRGAPVNAPGHSQTARSPEVLLTTRLN